jgi:hypothetical protein
MTGSALNAVRVNLISRWKRLSSYNKGTDNRGADSNGPESIVPEDMSPENMLMRDYL